MLCLQVWEGLQGLVNVDGVMLVTNGDEVSDITNTYFFLYTQRRFGRILFIVVKLEKS